MTLPAVASNLATKYESWIVATVGNMKYVDFFVLSFAESEFTGFLINRGCGNLLNIQF